MKKKFLYFIVSVSCILLMEIYSYFKYDKLITFDDTIIIIMTILSIIIVLDIIAIIVAIKITRHNNVKYEECIKSINTNEK